MSNVVCKYVAGTPTANSIGSITLSDCDPPISNAETISGWEVILIVIAIVAVGAIAQWFLHHINRDALTKLKADLVDLRNLDTTQKK
jgi:hypothetical protein